MTKIIPSLSWTPLNKVRLSNKRSPRTLSLFLKSHPQKIMIIRIFRSLLPPICRKTKWTWSLVEWLAFLWFQGCLKAESSTSLAKSSRRAEHIFLKWQKVSFWICKKSLVREICQKRSQQLKLTRVLPISRIRLRFQKVRLRSKLTRSAMFQKGSKFLIAWWAHKIRNWCKRQIYFLLKYVNVRRRSRNRKVLKIPRFLRSTLPPNRVPLRQLTPIFLQTKKVWAVYKSKIWYNTKPHFRPRFLQIQRNYKVWDKNRGCKYRLHPSYQMNSLKSTSIMNLIKLSSQNQTLHQKDRAELTLLWATLQKSNYWTMSWRRLTAALRRLIAFSIRSRHWKPGKRR